MELELKNVHLKNYLKVKGMIPQDAERFHINLGSNTDNVALHFNPRFNDETDGAVLVCNSKFAGNWGEEKRDAPNPLRRGSQVKIVFKLTEDMFEVELPDGHEVQFPNHEAMNEISYISIKGHFSITSFKIC